MFKGFYLSNQDRVSFLRAPSPHNQQLSCITIDKITGDHIIFVSLLKGKKSHSTNVFLPQLSAFYKICDRPWVYAEMTAEEPLCCDGGKVKVCPSVEKLNATSSVIIDAKTVM